MKVNQLKAGAVLSYVSMGLGYLVSIIYTPIMLRLLGQREYGLYNLVASVVAYLGILNFGFGSAYMRYYSRYLAKEDNENIAKLNGMFLIIFSAIGFIAAVSGTFLAINSELIFGSKLSSSELGKATILMMILVINTAVSFPNIIFTSYIMANERFVFQKLIQMVNIVVNPLVLLPVLIMGYGSVGMVISSTVLNVFIGIANAIFCIRKLKMKFYFKKFDVKLMREMTVFSSFIFINLIIDQINWNVDKFIIGRFHGTVSVAVYGIASQLNTYYLSISTTISSVFIPRVNRLVAGDDKSNDLIELFTRIGRIQFILLSLISIGMMFFGRPFINIWAGYNYDDSYLITLILIIPVTVPLIQNIGIEIQRAKNMHQFRSWVYLIIAIVNVAISIPLVKILGGVGAAIGTSVALIMGNGFVMNWYYHKKVGLDMKFFWKQIISLFPCLIPSIFYGILINCLFDLYNIVIFLVLSVIYVIIFSLSVWFFGMNKYEKDLMARPLKRVLKKFLLDINNC